MAKSTNSPSKGAVCRTCSKPGFKGADGKMHHERRTKADEYGGRRKDPAAAGAGGDGGQGGASSGKTNEREPERDHILNRRIGGQREG